MVTKRTKTAPSLTPIVDFMTGCRTKGTGYSYRSGILLFLDVMYGAARKGQKSTKAEFEVYEQLASKYLQEKRDHTGDLKKFVQYMTSLKTPSKTIKVKVQGVREWFIGNHIMIDDFDKREILKVMPRKTKRETNFDYFDYDKIQAMIPHLDIRMQAITLILVSSGARIGEVLHANIYDIRDNRKPVSIFVRDTKTGDSRRIFISTEAHDTLKAWLKSRDDYLKMAGERSTYYKITDTDIKDDRIFPFQRTSVYRAWERALKKAGLFSKDSKTDRNVLSIHRLRAFFRGKVASVIDADFAELMIGHEDEYGDTYRDKPEEELEQLYLKCQDVLTIKNSGRMRHDLEAQSDELQRIKQENDSLRGRLVAVEQRELKRQEATAMLDAAVTPDMMADIMAELKSQREEISLLKHNR
ncbi:MAG: tyrosine-type recombinase/integrase [Methanoregula sp.]